MKLYVDADACPVKNEIYKVAERHGLEVLVVSNSFIQVPRLPFIVQQVVDAGPDEADNWIAERAVEGDVVITADILLAERCLRAYTKANIASAVATRALMEQIRSTGEQTGGAPPFSQRDRSNFLQKLHDLIVRLKRN